MKRIIALIAAVSVTLSVCLASGFSDLNGHWAQDVMEQANENGLLYGENGRMNPDGLLTRAQLAAILVRALGATSGADLSGYTDVSPSDWFYADMAAAVNIGIIQGSGTQLMPNDYVTREQTFAVVARALALEDGEQYVLNAYTDASRVSTWAVGAVAAMAAEGYASGANGMLTPQAPTTRAQFAALIAKVFPNIVKSQNQSAFKAGNILLNSQSASISSCTVDGDIIIGDGVHQTELSTVAANRDILIRGGGERITLSNSTGVFGKLIIRSSAPTASVYNSSALAIQSVSVETNASLMGKFNQVAARADISVAEGIIQRIDANKEGMSISVQAQGIVNYIYVNANNVNIDAPTGVSNIIIGTGVSGTMVNGAPLVSSVVSNLSGLYGA